MVSAMAAQPFRSGSSPRRTKRRIELLLCFIIEVFIWKPFSLCWETLNPCRPPQDPALVDHLRLFSFVILMEVRLFSQCDVQYRKAVRQLHDHVFRLSRFFVCPLPWPFLFPAKKQKRP